VKIIVSLPEDLFRRAEIAAKRLRVSRGELYTDAIAKYLERFESETIIERLNEVYDGVRAELDPALQCAQIRGLRNERW
jgi:metal-responsive CopG/Arc/MetJ family transcriptional regulator